MASILAVLAFLPACDGRPAAVRESHLGKAFLENRDSRQAIAAFARAVELAPESAAAHRNLARAHLLARDSEAALAALDEAARREDVSAATSYLRGLALARLSRFEEARPFLEEAVRLDPAVANLRYQLAEACQTTGRHEEAIGQLHETLRLDPLHTGAHYKLLGYARRAGDDAEAERRNLELQRWRRLFGDEGRDPEALERCVYTRAEPLVPPASIRPEARPPTIPVRFVDATDALAPDVRAVLAQATTARVLDLREDGRAAVFFGRPGGGEVVGGEAADARGDVAVLDDGLVRLLRAGDGALVDATADAGLAGVAGDRVRWVDYEHDGDLDLAVASTRGLELWQNHGNGRYTEVAAEVGLEVEGTVTDLAAADLDDNGAIDLVVARGGLPTLVFENQRTGRFRRRPEPPGPWPPARRVLVDHLDDDGRPDVVLLADAGVEILHGRPRHRTLETGMTPTAAALIDHDNDGRLDVVVAGRGAEGRVEVRFPGLAVPLPDSSPPAPVRELVAVDFDADGDSDLLLVTAGGVRFWRNDGGNVHRQLKVRLVGTKTNARGLGAQLEVRRGDFLARRTVSELPVEIGVGPREVLDTVQVVWTNGIVDNLIDVHLVDVPAGPLRLEEKDVAAGSCPFLYAWDGDSFRFVTDILGNAPLGLPLRRDVPLDADPDELVRIGSADGFRPRDGDYVVAVTEEMREVLYLDQARLVAVDHPPDVEVHATDKLRPAPFPPSELWALGDLRAPRAADLAGDLTVDLTVDLTGDLAAVDGRFAPPGRPLPPPLRGMTEPRSLVLDFGPVDVRRPWVLALTGWLRYGDASTNIALSQGAAPVIPPRLEAETSAGWKPVDVVVGMPAGKTKTLLVDLDGKLPAGTRRLRLTTTFEIRWDRIALGERRRGVAVEHELAPRTAELGWHGFGEIRSRAPGHPTTPDFAAVSERPPWRRALQGWVTRHGDVRELLAGRDARLVLVAAGDVLELTFDAAALPPVPAGQRRTFFFFSVGWDKDGDVNVIAGDTVAPLPVAAAGDWRLRYNTRFVPRNRFRE